MLSALALALVSVLSSAGRAVAEAALRLQPPVPVVVLRPFDPPEQKWLAGHRGVDLAASPGDEVRAGADGVVSFAGVIAGKGVISITHESTTRLRTTYEPVVATVTAGQQVSAGQVIGRVSPTPAADHPSPGLHWGLIRGEVYLDPLAWLTADGSTRALEEIRLLPAGSTPAPPPPEESWQPTSASGPGLPVSPSFSAANAAVRPSSGAISSRFGLRLHPVLKVWKLHDGLDFAAACGSPVRAALAGTVVATERHVAYGNRVIIDHGGRRTAYAHLGSIEVMQGQRVSTGQLIAHVGNTGWSTGCHLHLMEWRGGQLVDPISWAG